MGLKQLFLASLFLLPSCKSSEKLMYNTLNIGTKEISQVEKFWNNSDSKTRLYSFMGEIEGINDLREFLIKGYHSQNYLFISQEKIWVESISGNYQMSPEEFSILK